MTVSPIFFLKSSFWVSCYQNSGESPVIDCYLERRISLVFQDDRKNLDCNEFSLFFVVLACYEEKRK